MAIKVLGNSELIHTWSLARIERSVEYVNWVSVPKDKRKLEAWKQKQLARKPMSIFDLVKRSKGALMRG